MFVKAALLLCTVSMVNLTEMDEDKLLFWRRASTPDCEPFTTFAVECNKCVCGAEGISYCTRMACKKKPTEPRRFLDDSEEDESD